MVYILFLLLKVVMYEPNEIYIKGEVIDSFNILPIPHRKNYNKVKDKIEVKNKNFYESIIEEKYDLVYCRSQRKPLTLKCFLINKISIIFTIMVAVCAFKNLFFS